MQLHVNIARGTVGRMPNNFWLFSDLADPPDLSTARNYLARGRGTLAQMLAPRKIADGAGARHPGRCLAMPDPCLNFQIYQIAAWPALSGDADPLAPGSGIVRQL